MADRKGDPEKQPPECDMNDPARVGPSKCPHMKYRDDTNFDAETYECKVCGEYYKLYYEDMA